MLDFGWQEFMVIAVVTVLVVGPKELPRVFRTITGVMRKARSLANEFHSAMDEMAREADLEDVKKEFNKVKNGTSDWVKDIDPTGEIDKSVKDMKDEVDSARKIANAPSAMHPTASYPAKTDPSKSAAETKTDEKPATTGETGAKKAATKKAAAKKTATKAAAKKSATKTATKKVAAKTADTKTAAKKTAAKKATAQKAAVKTAEAKPSPSPSATTPAPQIKSEPKDSDA